MSFSILDTKKYLSDVRIYSSVLPYIALKQSFAMALLHPLMPDTLEQRSPTPVLESYYPATFRCIAVPTQLNQLNNYQVFSNLDGLLKKYSIFEVLTDW